MRTKFLLSAAALLIGTAPILGHHAFEASSTRTSPCCSRGPVTKVEWVNPHAWIHLEVTKPDGTKEEWMGKAGTPNTLLRRGITRESLKVGTELVIDGYQARDHSLLRANGRNVTYPDGKKLFLGSSGTGAPTDGADPTEAPKRPAAAAADANTPDETAEPRRSQRYLSLCVPRALCGFCFWRAPHAHDSGCLRRARHGTCRAPFRAIPGTTVPHA
jgi:hypothetical protein